MKVRILTAGPYSDFSKRPPGAKRLQAGDLASFPDHYAKDIIAAGLAEPAAGGEAINLNYGPGGQPKPPETGRVDRIESLSEAPRLEAAGPVEENPESLETGPVPVQVLGLPEDTTNRLVEAGLATVESVAEAADAALLGVNGIGKIALATIRRAVADYLEELAEG